MIYDHPVSLIASASINYFFKNTENVMQFTGYKMFDEDVYFGDIVSNNFKTDKEVIREIVMHDGSIMMKRVKGNSKLPKYINLHEWHNMNFKIIGNVHQNPELI